MNSLPKGWTLAKIADTGRYINGFAFAPEHWGTTGRPIIRIQNLTDPERPFNRTTLEVDPDLLVETDEILVSWSATLDAFVWRGEPAVLNQHIFRVVPEGELVDSRFLFHLLRWSIWQMKETEHLHGSTMKHINRGPFLAFDVPIPPLNEQRRIVAEIEKQLTRLDAAVAALKRVQANLKRYRAAVLKAACEGRLVPTEAELARKEGRSYETGAELLARILQERRAKWEADQLARMAEAGKPPKDDSWKRKYKEPEPPDTSNLPPLPEGWTWASLDQLIYSGPQNGLYKPSNAYGSGTPIVRIEDYQFDLCPDLQDLKRVQASEEERTSYQLAANDIVLNRVNSPTHLGKSMAVPESLTGALFESNMMRFRLASAINPSWLIVVLQTAEGRARLIANAKWAVNQASINQEDVKRTAVPLPPAAEQARILNAVADYLSVVRHSVEDVEKSSFRADSLRQSILKRAFEGKLVPQDPNDEPASVLLERIRAERAAKDNPKRRNLRRQRQPRNTSATVK